MTTLMTPQHPQWTDFAERLMAGVAGAGCAGDRDAGHSHGGTIAALATTPDPDLDVAASLEFLKDQGGCCCDCEVIYNVILPTIPEPEGAEEGGASPWR